MANIFVFTVSFFLAVAIVVSCSAREYEQGMISTTEVNKEPELSGETQVFANSEKVAENEKVFRNTASPTKSEGEGAKFQFDYTDPGANTDPHSSSPTPP